MGNLLLARCATQNRAILCSTQLPALLQEEVKAAFGKHVLPHGARLVEEPEPKRIKGMMGIMRESVRRVNATLDAGFYANSAFKASSMFSWRKQTQRRPWWRCCGAR